MAPEKTKETGPYDQVAPGTAMFVLLAAMNKSGEEQEMFCGEHNWDTEDDADTAKNLNTSLLGSTAKKYEFEAENGARDLFYAINKVVEKIENCVLAIDLESIPECAGVDWSDYFDFKKTEVFLSLSPDENNQLNEIVVGNKERGWMVSFSSSVGEYYDENYDLEVSVACHAGLLAHEITDQIKKIANSHVVSIIESMEYQTASLIKSIHPSLGIDMSDTIFSTLQKQPSLKDAFIKIEKNMLKKALGYDEENTPKPKKETSPRSPKKI